MTNKIDLTPAILDLALYAGDGSDFQVNFMDEDGAPIDVSDLIWTAQIRKTRTAEIAYDLEIDNSDAASGYITIHISAETTRSLPKASVWDLQNTSVARPEPVTVLQGSVTCEQDVTREEVVGP